MVTVLPQINISLHLRLFLKEEECLAKFSRKCQPRSVQSSSAYSICGSRRPMFLFRYHIQLLKKEQCGSVFITPCSIHLFLSILVIFFILFPTWCFFPSAGSPAAGFCQMLVLFLPSFLVCAERCFCCCRSLPQNKSD